MTDEEKQKLFNELMPDRLHIGSVPYEKAKCARRIATAVVKKYVKERSKLGGNLNGDELIKRLHGYHL